VVVQIGWATCAVPEQARGVAGAAAVEDGTMLGTGTDDFEFRRDPVFQRVLLQQSWTAGVESLPLCFVQTASRRSRPLVLTAGGTATHGRFTVWATANTYEAGDLTVRVWRPWLLMLEQVGSGELPWRPDWGASVCRG